MSTFFKKRLFPILLFGALLIGVFSCNPKSDDDENTIAVTSSTVAIKSFSLQANDSVLAHLDSVAFSIDLNTGVIFNAISLPSGTDVSRIVPSIVFLNSMSKAEFSFLKDDDEIVTTDYLKNPGDSIDFTYPVTLNVTAADGVSTFAYQIKVNVYSQDPDSLIWSRLQTSVLPSRLGNPIAQKTVVRDDIAYCMVIEDDETVTLSICEDLNTGEWIKTEFNPGFFPDPESFTATTNLFYVLGMSGELFVSQDASTWQSTGQEWAVVLGAYGDGVLGIKKKEDKLVHTRYPVPQNYTEEVVAPDFPVSLTSSLGLIETKWASQPIAILAGGVLKDASISDAVWAYDGNGWAVINEGVLPALEMPMLARYVVYRQTTSLFRVKEFDVWLLFGGWTADDEMNREVYLSYDNGVSWQLAPEAMQLSDKVPDLGGADVIVAGYPLTADLADAWTPVESPVRSGYEIVGTDITWICPYMYIFGGYNPYPDNSLNLNIYRGVLDRLTLTPVI